MGNAVYHGHTCQQLEAQLAYTMFAPRLRSLDQLCMTRTYPSVRQRTCNQELLAGDGAFAALIGWVECPCPGCGS